MLLAILGDLVRVELYETLYEICLTGHRINLVLCGLNLILHGRVSLTLSVKFRSYVTLAMWIFGLSDVAKEWVDVFT